MKEMIYKKDSERCLLYNNIYKGFHYYIISYGTHPCAYIEIPIKSFLYGKGYMEIEDDYCINVHGGLTYASDYLRISDNTILENSWFIGWDYAHISDYNGLYHEYEILNDGTKKWTTEEINEECKNVIEQIINL